MPSTSRCSNFSSPPLRRHAAIERRSWSASPGVKPAATIASCITCSWKIGTPSVRASTLFTAVARIGDRLQALPPAQVRMHHAALDRPGAHDRDLDDEVVEARGLQARQHRLLRARLDLEHADGVGALDHRVDLGVLGRDVLHRKRSGQGVSTRAASWRRLKRL